jgi:hypothetical protein
MIDCKSMPTPMVRNLKKMNEASSESGEIDPHIYRQLIGSLMYLVKTGPDICYATLLKKSGSTKSRRGSGKNRFGKSREKIGKPCQTLKNTKYFHFFQNFKHIKQ